MQRNDRQLGLWFANNVMLERARFHFANHLHAHPEDFYIHGRLIWTFFIARQEIELFDTWLKCDSFYRDNYLSEYDHVTKIVDFYKSYYDENYKETILYGEGLKAQIQSFADLEYVLSKAYSELGDETKAETHLKAALELDPNFLLAIRDLARAEYLNKNFFKANQILHDFKEMDTQTLEWEYFDAKSIISTLNSIDYLIRAFYGFVKRYSLEDEASRKNSARILFHLSVANKSMYQVWVACIAYHKMNMLEVPHRLYSYYFRADPHLYNFVAILISYLGQECEYEKNIAQLDELIENKDGPLWLLYLYRGLHKKKIKDHAGYLNDIKESLNHDSKNVTALYEYISVERHKKSWESIIEFSSLTIEDFVNALYTNPYAWENLNYILKNRLIALDVLEKKDEIINCLENFEQGFEVGGEGFFMRGAIILAKYGILDKAFHYLEKALTINENSISEISEDEIGELKKIQYQYPHKFLPKYAIAIATAIQIGVEEAIVLMQDLYLEYPQEIRSLYHFAAMTRIVEDDAAALNLFEKGLQIDSTHNPTITAIAEIKLAAGKKQEVYELASTYPVFPGAFTPLVQNTIGNNDVEESIKVFRFIIEYYPDHFVPNMYLFSTLEGEERIKYGDKLFEVIPEDLHLAKLLADYHYEKENYHMAEKYYKELAQLTSSPKYLNKAAASVLLSNSVAD